MRKIDEQALFEKVVMDEDRPLQKDIAEELGISRKTIQRYQTKWQKEGRYFPRFKPNARK